MVVKLLKQYLLHFFSPPPSSPQPLQQLTEPTSQRQLPVVNMETVQFSQQPQPDNYLNHGPKRPPNNLIDAKSSPSIPFHSITLLIRNIELGKSLLSIGLPITIAVLISNDSQKFHTTFTYFMLSGLSIGSMAIWNGIVLRRTFSRTANVAEKLGILMVLLSLFGLLVSCGIPSSILLYLGCLLLSRLFCFYILP